jgi:hypothetical protein
VCVCVCTVLQALSTYQLSPGQVSDEALDVLTGFHVVDGALRLFVLEGPAQGKGMQHLVTAVARWGEQSITMHPAPIATALSWRHAACHSNVVNCCMSGAVHHAKAVTCMCVHIGLGGVLHI